MTPPAGARRGVMTNPILETRALCRNFGALAAARDINFRLEAGARHALIGPNGAGKTTFVDLLTGVLRPTAGAILLKGRDITGVVQAERVKLGIARTFQINRLFLRLSVLENVYIAVAERVGAAPSMFRPAGRRRDVVEESMHLLDTLKLTADAAHRISELPYGRQRLVELAIALGLKPEVLLPAPKATSFSTPSTACPRTSPCSSSITTWTSCSDLRSGSRCW